MAVVSDLAKLTTATTRKKKPPNGRGWIPVNGMSITSGGGSVADAVGNARARRAVATGCAATTI